MILRSTTAASVPTHMIGKFKALVARYASQEHDGMTVTHSSVIAGQREGAATHVLVLIDVEAYADAPEDVHDAAQETVAHALISVRAGVRNFGTSVEVIG